MKIITFYSYKGGVGRTLACANFGLYAARTGKKVVLIDMDFEAPGLDSKFDGIDIADFGKGVIDQFYAFSCGNDLPSLKALDISLPEDVAREGGRLFLFPAGDYTRKDYFQKLSGLSWETFVSDELGLAFCLDLVRRIEEKYEADLLVIDSRTGLTEVGGLATQILPDGVILLTSMSTESLRGTSRIHRIIRDSPIIKNRSRGRTSVDLRVVITRVPRPDDLPRFEEAVKKRLDFDVERLYYLFDQGDLSMRDYLAMDRFSNEPPAILNDYVELFSSLEPETNRDYIERRLEVFRSGITRRSSNRNEQIIQELRTLFPLPSVILEAARYYRIARQYGRALANYMQYFERNEADEGTLMELAEVCENAPYNELSSTTNVIQYLQMYGVAKMSIGLLERYTGLIDKNELWQEIVDSIENDDMKLSNEECKTVLFRAYGALEMWENIVAYSAPEDMRDRVRGRFIAEAHATLGNHQEMRKIISELPLDKPHEIEAILFMLFQRMPEANSEEIYDIIKDVRNLELRDIVRFMSRPPWRREKTDVKFDDWKKRLWREIEHQLEKRP